MPLNINSSDDLRDAAPGETPFSPPPGSGPSGGSRRILLWIFLVLVLVSTFFVLLQFGVIPSGGEGAGPGPEETDSVGSALGSQYPADEAADAKTAGERAAQLRQRLAGLGGEYTIFISALRDSADAGELAGRWEKAGYPTCVLHSEGWYRVGVGRYATPALARADAEKLRQALEEGYWIGRTVL